MINITVSSFVTTTNDGSMILMYSNDDGSTVAYLPRDGYAPYDNGKALGVLLKVENGNESLGVLLPGTSLTSFSPYSNKTETLKWLCLSTLVTNILFLSTKLCSNLRSDIL